MKRALIFIGIVVVVIVGLGIAAQQISDSIISQFTNITGRLDASVKQEEDAIDEQYEALLRALDQRRTTHPELVAIVGDSLEQLYVRHQQMLSELDHHFTHIRDNIIQLDPETGNRKYPTETEANARYWLGTKLGSGPGRGSGAARQLRDHWNAVSHHINHTNAQIAQQIHWDAWHQADTLEDQVLRSDSISWERYTFLGPAVANLATLEVMKLDQQARFMAELEFFLEVLVFEM
ncbi:MAG: hypothetical protein AAF399_18665 [Bacteroidota bacterium]